MALGDLVGFAIGRQPLVASLQTSQEARARALFPLQMQNLGVATEMQKVEADKTKKFAAFLTEMIERSQAGRLELERGQAEMESAILSGDLGDLSEVLDAVPQAELARMLLAQPDLVVQMRREEQQRRANAGAARSAALFGDAEFRDFVQSNRPTFDDSFVGPGLEFASPGARAIEAIRSFDIRGGP